MSSTEKIVVLGAGGFLGQAVFLKLKEGKREVVGVTRQPSNSFGGIFLDITDERQLDAFPWGQYERIVDCTGLIEYQKTPEAMERAFRINTIAPLNILKRLLPTQRYFYCSTHAVLIPREEHTAYSLSKMYFEKRAILLGSSAPKVTVVRIPAIFSEERSGGLLHTIKTHFQKKEALKLSLNFSRWHPMYLPRTASIFSMLAMGEVTDTLITLGYPLEMDIQHILSVAENTFGYSIPVHLSANVTDHYVPDLTAQNHYIKITPHDFEADLETYFNK